MDILVLCKFPEFVELVDMVVLVFRGGEGGCYDVRKHFGHEVVELGKKVDGAHIFSLFFKECPKMSNNFSAVSVLNIITDINIFSVFIIKDVFEKFLVWRLLFNVFVVD